MDDNYKEHPKFIEIKKKLEDDIHRYYNELRQINWFLSPFYSSTGDAYKKGFRILFVQPNIQNLTPDIIIISENGSILIVECKSSIPLDELYFKEDVIEPITNHKNHDFSRFISGFNKQMY